MIALYKSGKTSPEVAAFFGISPNGVLSLMRRYGIGRKDGGKSKAPRKHPARIDKQARRYQRWGASPADFQDFAEFLSVVLKYRVQRTRAAKRGIAWEFSLTSWWAVWRESGRWSSRGVGIGCYCMARDGDAGPYSKDNISIQLCTDNSRDGIKIAHATVRRNGGHTAHLGTGRGWTKTGRSKKNPFQVVAGRKYVGSFPTQEAAEVAYKAACLIHRECVSHSAI